MKHHNRGFTLAEVLVALAILSVIGLGCWQVGAQLLQTKSRMEERSARLREVQRGLWMLARDLNQIVDRTSRDPVGLREPAVTSLVPGQTLTLTRNSWSNPPGARRSQLQRVAYTLADDDRGGRRLVRRYWSSPDRSRLTPVHEQTLIDDVDYLEIQFIDMGGKVHFHWPLQVVGTYDTPGKRGNGVPAGLRIRLGLPPYGEIDRLFSLRAEGPES